LFQKASTSSIIVNLDLGSAVSISTLKVKAAKKLQVPIKKSRDSLKRQVSREIILVNRPILVSQDNLPSVD